jgi:antitoxin (DNA-binding transcriptional repressor) of toxin-antitoxin stability system
MAWETAMVLMIPIQQAVGQLVDLVRDLAPGDEIVLTDGGWQLARIVPEVVPPGRRRPGACKGMLEVLDEGDEVILEHFKEYLP